MDEVEHSWELRAPRGDRNEFRSTLRWMRARLCDTADLDEGQRLNLMDEVEHSWELRAHAVTEINFGLPSAGAGACFRWRVQPCPTGSMDDTLPQARSLREGHLFNLRENR